MLAPYRREGDDAVAKAFVEHRPLHIEIGFGRPHYLLDLARLFPEAHVLGFELRQMWVRQAAEQAERLGLANVRAIEGDARPHLERLVAPGSVDAFHVLFPDPWWKKRHHKRRVFNSDFVKLLVERLAPGGALVAKTDVEAYADQLAEELALAGLVLGGVGSSDPELGRMPQSHREKKCLELGIPIFMVRFVRPPGPTDPAGPPVPAPPSSTPRGSA
ncbi:MAG: tRNA (guanosine(46)-N7)-methyltransferase TrmB [Myxococcota bacterium]